MFTGIVTHLGRVVSATSADEGIRRLVIETTPALERAGIGDSVCVQGVCLTVTHVEPAGEGARYAFDAVPETLRRSTLGDLADGDAVNLEASLRVGDALGGHWVQGHVDGVGRVTSVGEGREGDVRITIGLPPELSGDVIPKGSVTLDGVSLTVGEVEEGPAGTEFSVYLIPHTLEVTTLSRLEAGAQVNLEMDVLGRWVAHHLTRVGKA
jgi:riboflavin synthase